MYKKDIIPISAQLLSFILRKTNNFNPNLPKPKLSKSEPFTTVNKFTSLV